MRAIWVLACLALATAGCSSGGGSAPLSEEEARDLARQAIEDLARDLAGDGGDISKLSADLDFAAPEFGSGSIQFVLEWGLQGTGAATVSMSAGAFSVAMEQQCGTERHVTEFGGERFETRPTSAACTDLLSASGIDSGGLDFTDFDQLQEVSVTPHKGGSVTAVYTQEDARLTVHVDAAGRVRSIDLEADEGSGTIEFERGARRLITPAPADDRMPSGASAFCFYSAGSCQADVYDGDDAPLAELEVRIYASGDEAGTDAPLATLAVRDGASQDGDWALAYEDDGDGLFGDGDSFTVTGPDADVEVVVWDLWADKDIRDQATPGPVMVALMAALVAAASVQRRAGKP